MTAVRGFFEMRRTPENMPGSELQKSRIHWEFWGLILILMIGAALRLYAMESTSLWLDEIWSVELASGRDNAHLHLPVNVLLDPAPALTAPAGAAPWWKIWTSMAGEPHPPLFFILLRWFRDVLGPTDSAGRMLPLIASVACIFLLYRCVAELSGAVPAFWAAVLMALSGQQILFAVELRSYSCVEAVVLGCCAVLIAIDRRTPSCGKLIALAFFAFVAVLLHYFAVGALAGLGAYAILKLRGAGRRRVVLALAVAAIVFSAVWGSNIVRQGGALELDSANVAFLRESTAGHVWHTIDRLVRVPAAALWPTSQLAAPWPAIVVTWLVAAIWLATFWMLPRRRDLLLWYLIVAGACGLLLGLDLARSTRNLAFDRYLLSATPAICAIFAGAGASWRGWRKHLLPGIMTLVCLVALPATFQSLQNRFDWQVVGSLLGDKAVPGDAIVIAAKPADVRAYYLEAQHYLAVDQYSMAMVDEPIKPGLRNALRTKPHTWVVFPQNVDAAQLFPSASFRPVAQVQNAAIVAEVVWTGK